MSVYFPSDAWIKQMMVEVNQSQSYLEAGKNWEGDLIFIIEPGGSLEHTAYLYMDLYHGQCRQAYEVVVNGAVPSAAFKISAPVATWKKVMTKKLDPMQALITGQLKLQGNMSMIMKNVRAAKELVETCTRIDTEFPV